MACSWTRTGFWCPCSSSIIAYFLIFLLDLFEVTKRVRNSEQKPANNFNISFTIKVPPQMIIVLYFLIWKKRNRIIYCCLNIIKISWNIFFEISYVLIVLGMRTFKRVFFKKKSELFKSSSTEINMDQKKQMIKNWSRDGFRHRSTSFLRVGGKFFKLKKANDWVKIPCHAQRSIY